jgi:hypothetical protein
LKLTAFQSDKGDCLLLESADGKNRMLVDGGIERAYAQHVAPALATLRKQKKSIDIAYISHIDEDHIAGILQLLDDEAAWRVHEHHVNNGNPTHPRPEVDRPAAVKRIFHNAFSDLIGDNSGEIEDMLAATATILSGAANPIFRRIAQERRELATSIPQALKVSKRVGKTQLNIPLNPDFGGKLMLVHDDIPSIALGSITLRVIGPFPADLKKLRGEWNTWLRDHKEQVKTIQTAAQKDASEIGSSVGALIDPMLQEAELLGAAELALAKELGNRKKVTTPNLASLMFLAEEQGQKILLTGDGHWEDIIKGLEHHQAFDANDKLHVDVLKVQHHGSEHNIAKPFCDRVTADRYVFCGNGEHENPDLDVLNLLFDQRMANDQQPFTFLFNSSSKQSVNADGAAHMKEVEKLVAKMKTKSQQRLRTRFITGSKLSVI